MNTRDVCFYCAHKTDGIVCRDCQCLPSKFVFKKTRKECLKEAHEIVMKHRDKYQNWGHLQGLIEAALALEAQE